MSLQATSYAHSVVQWLIFDSKYALQLAYSFLSLSLSLSLSVIYTRRL